MPRKILCTCLLYPNKNKVTSTSAFTHKQHMRRNRNLHKKGSPMNRVENNRSPIFCVCEVLVSDTEEALSRSQCLQTTMQQCANYLSFCIPPHIHPHTAPPTRKLLSHKLGSVTPLWMIVNMRLPRAQRFLWGQI